MEIARVEAAKVEVVSEGERQQTKITTTNEGKSSEQRWKAARLKAASEGGDSERRWRQ